jgi:hypothetical protein
MKKIMITMLSIILGINLIACQDDGEKENVYIDMAYEIYEFPRLIEELPQTSSATLSVGKKYVIYFDVDFTQLINSLGWSWNPWYAPWRSEEIEVTINVSLGAIDDREVNLLNGVNTPDGGFPYYEIESGKWQAKFTLSKRVDAPDLSKTPFNIWVYSVGNESSMQIIKVTMTADNKNIMINSAEEYALTINLQKGNFAFSKEDNLVQNIDYTGTIIAPVEANKVTFTYYTSNTKNTTFGMIEIINTGSPMQFDYAYHLARLYYSVEEPTISQVLNTKNRILQGDFSNYLVKIEADGGVNYNNTSFEYLPFA